MRLLPYFKWFPADAETDNRYSSLSDTELGFFHRCLNRAWINDGLPSDLDELARTMRVSRKYLDRMWSGVGRCFQVDENNPAIIRNPRQEEERTHARAKSEQASDARRSRNARSTDVERTNHHARYESESVSESILTISEWTKSSAIVCDEFPTTDTPLMLSIIHAAVQAAVSEGLTELPDEVLAKAIQQARASTPKQHSAVLFKTTVPTVIRNWAREAKRKTQ